MAAPLGPSTPSVSTSPPTDVVSPSSYLLARTHPHTDHFAGRIIHFIPRVPLWMQRDSLHSESIR